MMYNSRGMADSGIEVDFMSLLDADNDPVVDTSRFYELKNTVVVGSPVTEIKHASLPMRANLKQQLQRQQLLEEEKREQVSLSQGQSNNGLPHSTGTTSITVPRVVEAAEVPVNVLQVKTQLQHPTKYHVRQNQKRQVQHFLNEHQGGHYPIQSLPANAVSASASDCKPFHIQSSTSAPDPDLPSPLMGTTEDAEFIPSTFDLLGDLQNVDTLELGNLLGDSDLVEIQPSLGASSNGSLIPGFDTLEGEASSSCPTPAYQHQDLTHNGIMSVQDELWRKERIKKDNHNMIERRRRFNINDRIKELGLLLPRTLDPDSRQNKGTILKASVDYIKMLQDDQRKLRAVSEQKRKTEQEMRKMTIALNQMRSVIQSHGIPNPLSGADIPTIPNMPLNFLNQPPPSITTSASSTSSIPSGTQTLFSTMSPSSIIVDDLMMDESSPVSGDPMLLSDPVTPDIEEPSLNFTHHFHS